MEVEQIIALGDALKELTQLPARTAPQTALPFGCPLYAGIASVGELFGIGENTMRAIVKANPDFPALRIGKKILIDVPGAYEWMHEHNGQDLMEV